MKILIPFLLALVISNFSFSQNIIYIDAGVKDSLKISRHIYGHFAEHLGRNIYGGFYVGEDNREIPHTSGVRNDIIDALKNLNIPNLRWPGGCFADTYHWKDGIGPKDERPTIVNTWWGGVTEDNSFGTHDFLNMCEVLETEPYLAGNVGSGTVQEMMDWVQYTNFGGESEMSKLREKNGQKEPWDVKYWGVGNEPWGCGGNMTAEYYADLYKQYATYLGNGYRGKEGIYRIVSGPAGDDYHWTETLMKKIPLHLMEGLALHHYAVTDWSDKGPSTTFSEEQYFGTLQKAFWMDELIEKHGAIMDKYDPEKKIGLVVDEWGGWYEVEPGTNPGFLYQQNTMRDAMIAGGTLNIFNNHCDRVHMANLAQTVNVLQAVILTQEEKMLLTPTYHVMEMYKVHQDATFLPLQVQSNDYELNGEKLSAVSASASRDENGFVHLSLVNIHADESQEVTVQIQNPKYKTVAGKILTSEKLQDYNSFDNPDKIKPQVFKGAQLKDNTIKVVLPPFSVVMLELK
ncbi:MAG: alpha-N-arabinofuranosidase [Candidatus Cyclobacteriaceae bacterium M2_1C_046]